MEHKLTKENIVAIEKALNKSGSPKVEVCVNKGKVAVYQVRSTRVDTDIAEHEDYPAAANR